MSLAKEASRLDGLRRRTAAFVNSVCGSDLPAEVKEAALFNVSTLRTQTCFRTPDGTLFGWEGIADTQGCCHGSCTHVWNYEQATAFLFGDLAWSMREVEFGPGNRRRRDDELPRAPAALARAQLRQGRGRRADGLRR